MARRKSPAVRHLEQLEREAIDEARLALDELAPPRSRYVTELIPGGWNRRVLRLDDYMPAGRAAALTLMVYARRIEHVTDELAEATR